MITLLFIADQMNKFRNDILNVNKTLYTQSFTTKSGNGRRTAASVCRTELA